MRVLITGVLLLAASPAVADLGKFAGEAEAVRLRYETLTKDLPRDLTEKQLDTVGRAKVGVQQVDGALSAYRVAAQYDRQKLEQRAKEFRFAVAQTEEYLDEISDWNFYVPELSRKMYSREFNHDGSILSGYVGAWAWFALLESSYFSAEAVIVTDDDLEAFGRGKVAADVLYGEFRSFITGVAANLDDEEMQTRYDNFQFALWNLKSELFWLHARYHQWIEAPEELTLAVENPWEIYRTEMRDSLYLREYRDGESLASGFVGLNEWWLLVHHRYRIFFAKTDASEQQWSECTELLKQCEAAYRSFVAGIDNEAPDSEMAVYWETWAETHALCEPLLSDLHDLYGPR